MSVKVTVKYFGSVRDDAGISQEEIAVETSASVSEIIEMIKEKHSALGKRKGQILFALNQSYSSGDVALTDGDELALFPVVSGG